MNAANATVLRILVSSLAVGGLACRPRPRPSAPPDATPLVTAYVTPQEAQRLMDPLLSFAQRRRWALSVRTDSAALTEADLVIVDSGGRLLARVRAGSPVAAQARQLGEAVLPSGARP